MIEMTHKTIDVRMVIESVSTPESGGVDVFIGTTRNHSGERKVLRLEYEAYEPMAVRMMEQIAGQAKRTWDLHAASIVHRLGKVSIGEASVVIAVSASHREEAFKACRFLIDELKRIVPVWKREYFEDGSVEWSQHSHEQNVRVEREE